MDETIKGWSFAEHRILAPKAFNVLFMDTAWFQSEDCVKAWHPEIPTSVQHILTFTGKDFRFIEHRNLKQKTLWRVLWMADFRSRGEPGTTKNRFCLEDRLRYFNMSSAYCKWCNKCTLIHSSSIKALLWIMHFDLGKCQLSIVESSCLALANGWIEVAH